MATSGPEETGILEELGEDEAGSSQLDLGIPCVSRTLRGLEAAGTPALLLDRRLRIVWANPAFAVGLADRSAVEGRDLAGLFAESLDHGARAGLFRSVRSAETGYSWYGRLDKRIRGRLPFSGTLVVLPLFDEHDEPVAFQGIFSDISSEVRQVLHSTYSSLLEAARLKDNDTGNHIERVNRYSRRLAEELVEDPDYPEVDVEFLEDIAFLAAMHDVGKIGTPDDILNKAGRLEPWEWELMKEHTINGAYILASYPNPMARDIALRHHERWDGSGYPHGISEALIPLSARIVAVTDVYDALRMKRPYKAAMGHEEASGRILEQKGRHFEPHLIDCFQRLAGEFRVIFEELGEERPQVPAAGGEV